MAWTTAIQDLRILLSDGATDKYNFRKRCFGEINGTNTRFKTFDFRRITDFTVTDSVFLDGVLQPSSAIVADSPLTGEFILQNAPIDGSLVEASYYIQWFLDAELEQFVKDGSLWLSSTTEYINTAGGLRPALLKYAASEAYLKMSQRWKIFMSEMYKVEDAPKGDATGKTDDFIALADTYRKQANELKLEFYTRQGRNYQPLFGTVVGNVRAFP